MYRISKGLIELDAKPLNLRMPFSCFLVVILETGRRKVIQSSFSNENTVDKLRCWFTGCCNTLVANTGVKLEP